MAEPADHAWGHCLAVLRLPGPAESAAIAALRRGGRSRTAVLAHARFQALNKATAGEGAVAPAGEPLDPDLALISLAVLLAGTRPAAERAVLDLDSRLDRARLGRALGWPAPVAAARVAEVGQTWDRLLDPALLAWLGAGDCAELADVLAEQGLDAEGTSVEQLLDAAAPVAAHAGACELCGDRFRSMVSVRALFTQWQPPPVPEGVRAAGRAGRFRLPSTLPPPIDAAGRRRWPRRVAGVAAAILVVAGAAGGFTAWVHRSGHGSATSNLATVPASTSLSLSPATLSGSGMLALRNTSARSISWQATTTAEWISITPASGQLQPGQEVQLGVELSNTAPPAPARINVAGSDGSAAASDVNGPPGQHLDVAATANHCTVRAQVIDDVDVAVTLHYQATGQLEQTTPMASGPTGFEATLPASPTETSWWVTAVDSRGASGQTAPTTITPGSCSSP